MSKDLTLALQIKADVNQAQQAIQQLKNDVQNTANTVANAEQKQQQSHKQTSQVVEKQADAVEQLANGVDDLAQAEQKATQQTERMSDAIDDNVQSTQRNIDINQKMEQSLKSLTPHFMALIGLSGGLMTATMDVLEKSSQLKNMSTISGMNVEQFQYYAVGAKSVGVEMDKLSDIFKDTRDKVGDFLATGGGELKDFFDDIAPKVGVTAEQFRGLSGADALQLYVDSLRKANLSENEMIFYMESIADEASALLPLLNQGGEGFRKYLKPQAKVIYNDFDNFSQRLQHIDDTNRLRQIIVSVLDDCPRQKRIPADVEQKIISIINDFDGYVDCHSVSTWLLFSGKQISHIDDLAHHEFYNKIRRSDYEPADGYLDGLEITSESFETLMPRYYGQGKTLFILDPPYLRTKQEAYGLGEYFGMVQFLKLMRLVRPPYLFFSSTKSEFLAYMDYIKDYDSEAWQRLGEFERLSFMATVNKDSKYEDNMIFKI